MFYGNLMAPIPLYSIAYICVIDEFFRTSITLSLFSDPQSLQQSMSEELL